MSDIITGSATDTTLRLQRWLPSRWFPTGAGTRTWATLCGAASVLAVVYQQVAYARLQTRLATTTDGFLDLAAADFLENFPRRLNESDPSYSLRIRKEILRPRNTRAAIIQVVQDLTGETPVVFRPTNPNDTGGWGMPRLAYGKAGGWGSYALPYQAFVTVPLATAPGTAGQTSGANGLSGYGQPLGGYGEGAIGWNPGGGAEGAVTADDIYAAVASVTPAGHINWVAVTEPA